jgi:putative ABC transport system substrate-binding protein
MRQTDCGGVNAMFGVRRREFMILLGAATAWPLGLRAREERMRRIGVLTPLDADDQEHQARLTAFVQSLEQFGWTVGRNVHIDTRAGAGDPDGIRRHATQLVALAPDVILATGGSVVGPLLRVTRSVPIVFTQTPDPVGAGFVDSLARPGGNATGFTLFEYETGAKWLELLKEIAPGVVRAAVIRDASLAQGAGQLAIIQTAAQSFGVEVTPVNVHHAEEIERDIAAFARSPNGGLIVTASGLANFHRQLIIALAARHGLPAVYFYRLFAPGGGLISYGPDSIDSHRRAAAYVDRILKGEKPADLPVQNPTKYELVINLKTAKALGLEIPPMLLARADEVIE